jgi:NO-binding membrane sensor protein with MHYT domain
MWTCYDPEQIVSLSVLADSPLTPLLVFAMAAIGCLLGLHCIIRSVRTDSRGKRIGWVLLGGWAFGSTTTWDTYLLASVHIDAAGLTIRYDLLLLIGSVLFAIFSAAIGTLIASGGGTVGLLAGGGLVGLTISAGNLAALNAIRLNATMSHNWSLVVAATLIAPPATAAIVALAMHRRLGPWSVLWCTGLLAAVMVGVHYLSLLSVNLGSPTTDVAGGDIKPIGIVVPLGINVVARVVALLLVLLSRESQVASVAVTIPAQRQAAREWLASDRVTDRRKPIATQPGRRR